MLKSKRLIEDIIGCKLNKGVYRITNKLNGKVYIGESGNLRIRFRKHLYNCSKTCSCADAGRGPISLFRVGLENVVIEVLVFSEYKYLRKMIECQFIEMYQYIGDSLNQRYSILSYPSVSSDSVTIEGGRRI